MKHFGWLALLLVLIGARAGGGDGASAGGTNGIVYVNDNATGLNNGTSWKDAYKSLQSGLTAADAGDEVWVAGGTYTPSAPAGRNATFEMKQDVSVYGGFQGYELLRSERILQEGDLPRLSGNIGARVASDNVYHIVSFPAGVAAILSGFVISGGYTDGTAADQNGAGASVTGEGSRIDHVIFEFNRTSSHGAGLWVKDGGVRVSDAVFRNNTGGDLMSWSSETWVERATFEDTSDDALQAWGNSGFVQATNVTIVGAGKPGTSGATVGLEARLYLNNVTITGFSDPNSVPIRQAGQPTSILLARNVVVWGNDQPPGSLGNAGTFGFTTSIVEGGCPALASCISVLNVDPGLDLPAALHGGFPPTIGIPATSPAVDSGSGGIFCPAVDARGGDRPWDGDGDGLDECDMGAFEYVEPPTVQFKVAAAQSDESAASIPFSFVLSHPYPDSVSFEYLYVAGSATPDVDFVMIVNPQSHVIKAGAPGVTVAHPILQDGLDELDETATFRLQNPKNATLGAQTTFTVTITDDDTPPAVSFEAASATGAENKPATVKAKLSAVSGRKVTVNLAAGGGTAAEGVDYKLTAPKIVFAAGETSKAVPLSLVNDWTPEDSEALVLALKTPDGATLGDPKMHTFTISDDDKVRFCQGKKVTIYGTPGKDKLSGTPKVDIIDGLGNDDTIRGGGGNDVLCGSGGKDTLRGGPGNDTINGGNGADKAFGGGGGDTLLGKAGADTLRGELGRDRLAGGSGKPDLCDGGPSTDVLLAAHGCESVVGVP